MYPLLRIMRAGVLVALAVGAAGWAFERARFGASDRDAARRAEPDARRQIDEATAILSSAAAGAARHEATIRDARRDPAALRALFAQLASEIDAQSAGRTGVTVYDGDGMPLAWAGRVSEQPREGLQVGPGRGPIATLLAAPGALGPRLIRVRPLADSTIVAEQSLGAEPAQPGATDRIALATPVAPVIVTVAGRSGNGEPAQTDSYAFVIAGADGAPLFDAVVAFADVRRARDRWDHVVGATALTIIAMTLLLCTGPLIERRRRARSLAAFLAPTSAIVAILLGARAILWVAVGWLAGARPPDAPIELLLTAFTAAALAWIAVDLVERRPLRRPRPRLLQAAPASAAVVALLYAAAGAAGIVWLWTYERALGHLVAHSTLDLLHFSLHPINGARLALTCGLVVLHAAVIWTGAAFVLLPGASRRTARTPWWRGVKIVGWTAGVLAATVIVERVSPLPVLPLWVAVAVAGAAAVTMERVSARLRRASQTARMLALFAALLAPAVAMYPSVHAFAGEAKERLIAEVYGPQAASQREDLERRVRNTLAEIDGLRALPQFVAGADVETPTTDRAFVVWSQTDLAHARLTSAVELFNADGRLVSRFALSLPEYSVPPYRAAGCGWEDIVDEVSPIGSSERHVLRTSRGICDRRGRVLGGIVVRAMLDPQTLPFISSQSPYLESLRLNRQAPAEGVFGRDIELAMYGWSRAPTYAGGSTVWRLPDPVFDRLVESREPFWAALDRDEQAFRVYLLSDRGGIYALGYPVTDWLGHLINLSELVLLAGALYVAVVVISTLFSILALRTPASGRALLHEIRSSFYLKLFLAFVASVVVPVAILAVATRTYFANQLFAGAEDAAARTVTTAQRLVEDYATLQQRTGAPSIDDQIMVLVSRAIDEDVNLFERQHLQATSARDLFASQLLSPRTPADVYRRILLDRLPTFVGDERVGDFPYRLAAAPVRAGGREGVVTVPVTNRQQDIEQQIDELDRRVVSGALLFSLLGAALGYWMAERIADPVNRLTRATRRIARGDLDARIAATSSDELRRLVDDFNQMAADLKRQRSELERTQRLEAWADMARQVAHDIKNPLTPIQLSAEHARRVNIDRGRPLSPVLDECITAILGQVALLRQISAEFSSFASAPTPRPEPTEVAALIEDVVAPYRMGLAGRITIAVEAARGLPQPAIDRTLFSRALTNVIENALHAMPGRGQLTVTCHLSALDAHRAIVVDVTDTGVGMDAEALAKIFEPYFSTKATGTGLGLTIAKRNIELNGGTIDVRSQRGLGTTVTMTIPI